MTEFNAFAGQLVRRPHEVSALAPSSPDLCRLMADQLPRWVRRVAEFGPGTGNITRELLRLGIAPADLSLYEVNPAFCRMLRERYPDVAIHNRPAQELADTVPHRLDAVVSGLPLLSMSAGQQEAILAAAFSALVPDGLYVQFTYGLFAPVRSGLAKTLGLDFTRSARVWRNLPPATVYVYRRKRTMD